MTSPVPSTAATLQGVPSPCTNVCRIEPASGWCEGCQRTIEEIMAWGRLDDADKRRIWLQLEGRRNVKEPRA